MNMKSIEPAELHRKYTGGEKVNVIDVRTPGEFSAVRIAYARNIPLQQIGAADPAAFGNPDQTVYVTCKAGPRATAAAGAIAQMGFRDVVLVDGGMDRWKREGLPIEQDDGTAAKINAVKFLSLAALAAGVALYYWVNPRFLYLAAAGVIAYMYAARYG